MGRRARAHRATKGAYLTRGHQLVGQVESTKGLYLLSGMLACGVCRNPLIALKRGRNQTLAYVCRERRDRQACTNSTGVPMMELHSAVIAALRETFTEESFTRHLQEQANDLAAREQRAAERAHLLTEIPKYAATEQRLVKRIAMVEDDALVGALKAEWSEVKAQREQAERRLAELEGIERDLQADRAEVEQLREVWKSWSATLQAALDGAPTGSFVAESHQQARQILKKVLAGPIEVVPNFKDSGT